MVFCLDFDETLMNTDRLRADLLEEVRKVGGEDLASAYQEAYEATRSEHGVPHLPLVIKKLADTEAISREQHFALVHIFHSYPYNDYLYPGAEEAVTYLRRQGRVLLFSDGNAFFQPQKIYATAIRDMVDSIVVLPNKTAAFEELSGYWPAEKYVFIDDKQKVLDAAKSFFGEQATTVLVRQGRYVDTSSASTADISVASISDVTKLEF